jgi:hypothetical protein
MDFTPSARDSEAFNLHAASFFFLCIFDAEEVQQPISDVQSALVNAQSVDKVSVTYIVPPKHGKGHPKKPATTMEPKKKKKHQRSALQNPWQRRVQ